MTIHLRDRFHQLTSVYHFIRPLPVTYSHFTPAPKAKACEACAARHRTQEEPLSRCGEICYFKILAVWRRLQTRVRGIFGRVLCRIPAP